MAPSTELIKIHPLSVGFVKRAAKILFLVPLSIAQQLWKTSPPLNNESVPYTLFNIHPMRWMDDDEGGGGRDSAGVGNDSPEKTGTFNSALETTTRCLDLLSPVATLAAGIRSWSSLRWLQKTVSSNGTHWQCRSLKAVYHHAAIYHVPCNLSMSVELENSWRVLDP